MFIVISNIGVWMIEYAVGLSIALGARRYKQCMTFLIEVVLRRIFDAQKRSKTDFCIYLFKEPRKG